VLLEAVKNGDVKFKDLPSGLQEETKFILAAVEYDSIYENEDDNFYHLLPEHLQSDEDFCLQCSSLGTMR
jgi:hypothetical protein